MSSKFLPIGLILAFAVSWVLPDPGKLFKEMGLIPWMVVTIFLINGYQTQLRQVSLKGSLWITTLFAILINLVLSPFLGAAIANLLALPTAVAIGLIVTATVPATLSSGIVMTRLAGGDAPKALFLTITLNLLGVFTIPFMLQWVLAQGGMVDLSPWPLLQKLVMIVLIPFLIGMVARYFVDIDPANKLLVYTPSSCVIATVWMSVSASSDTLRELSLTLLLTIAVASIILHGCLLFACYLCRLTNTIERGEWLALLFTASQKTLPVSVGVLTALNHPVGVALVVCVIFHFLQLFVDAILADRLSRHPG